MGVQYTPNFHIAYLDAATPLADLDTVTQQVATSLDAAMGRAGYTPPDSSSFAAEVTARQNADTALAGRVTTLEQAPTRTAPVALGMNAPWTNYASDWTPLRVWTEGRTGFLTGAVKPTSAVAAGDYAIAAVPVGTRPVLRTSVWGAQGRMDVASNGAITLSLPATGANALVVINLHWSLD